MDLTMTGIKEALMMGTCVLGGNMIDLERVETGGCTSCGRSALYSRIGDHGETRKQVS